MADFISMHGYGAYIWGAYGAAFFILGGLIFSTFIRRAKLKKTDKK